MLTERANRIVPQNGEELPSRPVGRPKSVNQQIADATGLGRETVRRAMNPASPKPQLVEVKDAFDMVAGQADAIVRAWNRACPEARQLAMEQIDVPVFDRARAA